MAKKRKIFIAFIAFVLIVAILAGLYWYFFMYKKVSEEGNGGTSGGNEQLTPDENGQTTPGGDSSSDGNSQTKPGGDSSSGGNSQTKPGGGNSSSGGNGQIKPGDTLGTDELTIHFLELGNKYAGDCIFIQIGDVDILIDGGSKYNSADTIETYINQYCTDGILEYVIVTHAHEDHIAALAGDGNKNKSLFERFEVKTIIDFPKTDKSTQVYKRYVASRDAEVEAGAVHYTALQCYNEEDGAQRSYELAEGVTMNFLYNYYYDHKTSDENNYSVCMYINQGEYNYLFTGDLEEDGEKYLVQYNEDLPKCKLYKAGHHGSKTSSTEVLLSIIQPEYVCVCCCAGSPEYTTNNENTFPTQIMIDNVSKYTDKIYVTSLAINVNDKSWDYTSMNGNIVVTSDGKNFTVEGSNNSEILKNTDWFKENRVWNGV